MRVELRKRICVIASSRYVGVPMACVQWQRVTDGEGVEQKRRARCACGLSWILTHYLSPCVLFCRELAARLEAQKEVFNFKPKLCPRSVALATELEQVHAHPVAIVAHIFGSQAEMQHARLSAKRQTASQASPVPRTQSARGPPKPLVGFSLARPPARKMAGPKDLPNGYWGIDPETGMEAFFEYFPQSGAFATQTAPRANNLASSPNKRLQSASLAKTPRPQSATVRGPVSAGLAQAPRVASPRSLRMVSSQLTSWAQTIQVLICRTGIGHLRV